VKSTVFCFLLMRFGEKGFGVIFPALDSWAGFKETRDTLDMIEAMDVRLVIPGHGRPFTQVQEAIEAAHSRLNYLEADLCAMRRMALRY
jgi:glyoxylase-like metal-dependent hydrolase (beta-lactamase superfamily II)